MVHLILHTTGHMINNIHDKTWFLITSKPHKDSEAEEQLRNQGYEVYRPLANRLRTRGRKKVNIIESLFPRYLFICMREGIDDWGPIRSTRGVHGVVKFGGTPVKVEDALINEIRIREDDLRERVIDLDRFQEGQVIKIDDGPLKGMNGLFSSYAGELRVIILLDLLGKKTSLSIDLQHVSPE